MAKVCVLPLLASAAAVAALQCTSFSPRPLRPHHVRQRTVRGGLINPTHLCAKSKVADDDADTISESADPREGSLAAATKKLGKVPYGETSRKYRRTVFRHKDWVEHRSSSSRILSNLQSMFFSGVVRQLRPQVTAVTISAVLVLSWNSLVTAGVLPLDNVELHELALPTLPFTLSSPALGLLLVFRTNAAYQRWITGRDAWSRIIVHAKNLVRMTSVFSSDADAVDDLSKTVWLYCRSVMNKLSSPYEDEGVYLEQVGDVFGDSPMAERVVSSSDPALAAWKELSIQLHALPTSDPKSLIETDKSIIILGEQQSVCEKIFASPVPLVYTRHTARFLSLWALLLPFALYSAFSSVGEVWAMLPASGVLAFFLFGVDELAMQLEEPFSILPMQAFCDEVRASNVILVGKNGSDEQ